MHFGLISPPVPGHLHPFGALGRELMARGHQVTVFHMPDLETRVRAEALGFVPIGLNSHPPGTLSASLAKLGRLDGLGALRFTIGEVRKTTDMMLRDGPDAIARNDVGALLVDQTEPAGGTIAERLNIPFITICNALALNREASVPPPFTGWRPQGGVFAQARNQLGYGLSNLILKPVRQTISEYRTKWNLPPHCGTEASFSQLAQISQQVPAFDFPRQRLPECFHYVGPLRMSSPRPASFPWEKLDGRPLVYASLGTLQNGKERVFRTFAEASLGLPVQLVIAHGGGLDEKTAASFPGAPITVNYAPQLEVLSRARLTLTHAGLNTALDSLACGVPMVAVPITYEQPAIARRIVWSGAGRVIPFSRLSVRRLRAAMHDVLSNPVYTERARVVQRCIQESGGVRRAADLIETALAAC
ncbi:MAG: glycosyl transferase family 1 [Acidobacteriota bacterium]|nr:glycosyl transferase family 1 [Acidobacteriota bacterium]